MSTFLHSYSSFGFRKRKGAESERSGYSAEADEASIIYREKRNNEEPETSGHEYIMAPQVKLTLTLMNTSYSICHA